MSLLETDIKVTLMIWTQKREVRPPLSLSIHMLYHIGNLTLLPVQFIAMIIGYLQRIFL